LGKVAGYINIQNSVAFLYTTMTEKEIRETIPCTITSKTIKWLGINFMKETKDLLFYYFYSPYPLASRQKLFCPYL
jgi:hypothetical protein